MSVVKCALKDGQCSNLPSKVGNPILGSFILSLAGSVLLVVDG